MRVIRRTPETFELELTMRDVLGNLEELTLKQGYAFPADCFELIAIEPETSRPPTNQSSADILLFPRTA